VEQFLSEHPTVSIHYTPNYCSWLNQVELWFAKIQRDVIAWRFYFCHRSEAKTYALHSPVQQNT
jgi:transposase